jgi:hypothetical protein
VKALVEAGADLDVKNDAGHDAVFLAERTAWAAVEGDEDVEGAQGDDAQTQEIEMTIGENEGEEKPAESAGEMSAGRQVVEWLLASDVGASLEKGATEGEASGSTWFLSMRSEMIEEKFKISRIEWDIWVLSILAYVVR